MKYNLRTIKGKRVVGGDPNLATKHEIHVSKVPEELGISNNGEEDFYYYKVNKDALDALKEIDKSFDFHKPICRVFSEGPKPGGCIFYHYGLQDRRLSQKEYTDAIDVKAGRIPTTYMFGYMPNGYTGYAKPAKVRIEDPKLMFIINIMNVMQVTSGEEFYNFSGIRAENAEEIIESLDGIMKAPEILMMADLLFKGILEGHQISSPVVEIITKEDYYNILEEEIKQIESVS